MIELVGAYYISIVKACQLAGLQRQVDSGGVNEGEKVSVDVGTAVGSWRSSGWWQRSLGGVVKIW